VAPKPTSSRATPAASAPQAGPSRPSRKKPAGPVDLDGDEDEVTLGDADAHASAQSGGRRRSARQAGAPPDSGTLAGRPAAAAAANTQEQNEEVYVDLDQSRADAAASSRIRSAAPAASRSRAATDCGSRRTSSSTTR